MWRWDLQLVTFVKMCPFFLWKCVKGIWKKKGMRNSTCQWWTLANLKGQWRSSFVRQESGWPIKLKEGSVRMVIFFLFLSAKNGYFLANRKMKMTLPLQFDFFFVGKKILKFVFLWILPIWAFSLLVAAGTIKLNVPLLDDLIMWSLIFC